MSLRAITFGFAAAATQKWVTDADLTYAGANICVTTSAVNLLITTDPGLTRAVFVAPTVTGISSYDVVDYIENSQQTNSRITGKRDVFLPKGTSLYLIASAQMAAILYFENASAELLPRDNT